MTKQVPAKERLLKAAAELFYRNGVAATGIDAITAQAGVAKMSLYNNFDNKSDLVQAYLDVRVEEWRALCRQRLAEAVTPRERLLAVFDSYLDHAHDAYRWGFRGCGLLNAAAELPMGEAGRATVSQQKEEVEELFRSCLRDMKPGAGAAIDQTAEHLSFVLEGAMARAGLDGHDGRLQAARRIAVSILDAL
jgi:AcrR family transcriptional regulator